MTRQPGIPPTYDELSPRAPATGPFARRPFLATVTAFSGENATTVEADGGALVVVEGDGEVRLAGDPELTDYHCPVGVGVKSVIHALVDDGPDDTTFRFDSLPSEAAGEVADGFTSAGLTVNTERHEVTAVIEVPGSFEEHLAAVGKKQRHEIRRKRRRYVEAVGDVVHEIQTSVDWGLDEFFRLHRMSDGAKGGFMTPERERFFSDLLALDGWRVDLLRIPGTDRASACCFSYVDDEGAYLYNSAYDIELRDASPGVVMIGSMIERAASEGLPRFDFLKGDETYKFRLGAQERPLYEVVARR